MNPHVLVINPGSTTTKIAVFKGEDPIFTETIRHPAAELACFVRVMDQEDYRRKYILDMLQKNNIDLHTLDVVIGRGGLVRPVRGGVYAVNEPMLADLRACHFGTHAANLGAILAHDLAAPLGLPCFIADPVVVDELSSLARYSGHPLIARRSIFHALNHKAVALRVARTLERPYADLRLIVAHLGGGVSVGAHAGGRVVDVNNALDGDGPFSPERSGALPAGQLIDWCFAPDADEAEIRKRITGQGGFMAYLGTSNGLKISERMRNGDACAQEVHAALAYQVAKEIGAMGAVLDGQVDAIILTGGLAFDDDLVELISARIGFLGQVLVFAGEDEMLALAEAASRALGGEEQVLTYPK